MNRRERADLEQDLALIRAKAEELHAKLFDAFPAHAARMRKIASYTGELSTCLRVHGTLPDPKPGAPLVEAAKAATQLTRDVQKIARLIPRRDS